MGIGTPQGTFLLLSLPGNGDRDSTEWSCSPPSSTCPQQGCKEVSQSRKVIPLSSLLTVACQ